jgi:hypothetical protein
MRVQFNSLAEFGNACKSTPKTNWSKSDTGEDYEESVRYAIGGDTSRVSEAEKLLDKVNAGIELPARQWETAAVGFFPSVPDYLSGHPECMRRIGDAVSEHVPVRIFVCTTSSASMNYKVLEKRGISILAAAMALARSRPVELWTFTALDGSHEGTTNIMVRIASNPLMLSEACYALTSIGFDRQLTHAYALKINAYRGGWASFGHSLEGCKKNLAGLVSEQDIIIPPSFVTDDLIIKDPLAWVNKTLERFQVEQEEYA